MQVCRNSHILSLRGSPVSPIRNIVIVNLLCHGVSKKVEIAPNVKLTHVVLREINGLFCYPWARDRLDEYTRIANVELIIDRRNLFHLEGTSRNGDYVNRNNERGRIYGNKCTHRKTGSPVTLVSWNAVYHTGRSE
jgi:hypothetical protein